MKRNLKKDFQVKSEYTVEFQCASTFLVGFQASGELTDRQILAKAIEIADSTFEKAGFFRLERQATDNFYTFTALGIDRTSGHVLGKPGNLRPLLKLVK